MATASFTTPSSPLTMAALAAFLDAALGELRNAHRGASAPDSPIEGQRWWDTSGGATAEILKRYTAAAGWVSLLTMNVTTGAITQIHGILDENDMASDSAVLPPSQQSVKAYVDVAFGELLNNNRSSSAPDSPVEGQLWWDTSGDPVDTLKRYTVAAGWISLLTVNKTTGVVTVQSLTLTPAATGFTIAGGTTSKTLTLDTNVTATNLMLKTGSNLAVGSDANGDMYYRAAGVLARLAKGTANHKMFMNAAGTAPEWAKGIKVITSTRDMTAASGDVAYSGVGFKPSAVLIMAGAHGSLAVDHGWFDGTTMASMGYGSGNTTYNMTTSQCIMCYQNTAYQGAVFKSFDTDGFTLTWTKSGSPTLTLQLYFICFR